MKANQPTKHLPVVVIMQDMLMASNFDLKKKTNKSTCGNWRHWKFYYTYPSSPSWVHTHPPTHPPEQSVSRLPQLNQQRALNKPPTELRCENYVDKHRPIMRSGAKTCKKHVRNVYVFRLSFHFACHRLLVGKEEGKKKELVWKNKKHPRVPRESCCSFSVMEKKVLLRKSCLSSFDEKIFPFFFSKMYLGGCMEKKAKFNGSVLGLMRKRKTVISSWNPSFFFLAPPCTSREMHTHTHTHTNPNKVGKTVMVVNLVRKRKTISSSFSSSFLGSYFWKLFCTHPCGFLSCSIRIGSAHFRGSF